MTLSSHIVRRGIEAAHGLVSKSDGEQGKPGGDESPQIPAGAALIFILTGMLFLALMFCVSCAWVNDLIHRHC